MELNRRMNWLASWASTIRGEQQNYLLPPMLQPTIDCSYTWPLNVTIRQLSGVMGNGTNSIMVVPGVVFPVYVAPASAAVYPINERGHSLIQYVELVLSNARNVDLNVLHNDQIIDRLFAGNGTQLFPMSTQEIPPDRRHLRFPIRWEFQILAAVAAETFTLTVVSLELPETDPINL